MADPIEAAAEHAQAALAQCGRIVSLDVAKDVARAAITAYEEAHRAELLRGFGDPDELAAEVERQESDDAR